MKKVLFTYSFMIFYTILLTQSNCIQALQRQTVRTVRQVAQPKASWWTRLWQGSTPAAAPVTVPAVNVPAAGYSSYSRFQPTTTPEEPTRQVQSAESTPVQSQPAQPETWQSRAWSLPQQSPSMMRQPATTPVRPSSPSQTGWFGGWFGGSSQPRQPIGARQPFETKRSGFHTMGSSAMLSPVSGAPQTSVRLGQGDFPRSFSTSQQQLTENVKAAQEKVDQLQEKKRATIEEAAEEAKRIGLQNQMSESTANKLKEQILYELAGILPPEQEGPKYFITTPSWSPYGSYSYSQLTPYSQQSPLYKSLIEMARDNVARKIPPIANELIEAEKALSEAKREAQ